MAGTTSEEHKSLEEDKADVLKLLRRVEWALEQIEKGRGSALRYLTPAPADFPSDPAKWREYWRKHPPRSMKDRLLDDRTVLRDLLADLTKARAALNRKRGDAPGRKRRYERDDDQAANTPLERSLRRMSDEPTDSNMKEAINALANAQRDGLGDDEFAKAMGRIKGSAERALGDRVNEVAGNPSTRNCRRTIDSLANFQLLGGDTNSEASRRAMGALQRATTQRTHTAERRFRNNPTSKNLERALDEMANNHLLGGEADLKRPGWRPAGGLEHTTGPGDTLSRLSKRYYGEWGFWDVIFMANLTVIKHPDSVPRGLVLTIP